MMKVRVGFVSNSSSASFIVIDTSKGYEFLECDKTLVINGGMGETEYGWGPEKVKGIGSKIIFSFLQAQYSLDEENDLLLEKARQAIKESNSPDKNKYLIPKMVMLEKVIKENSNAKKIIWDISIDSDSGKDSGYIDHQSVGESNLEMFDSKEKLRDFIFGKMSYIQVDNDNH